MTMFYLKIHEEHLHKIYDSRIDLRTTKRPEKTHPTTVGHRSKRGWEGCCGSVDQHPLQQQQQQKSQEPPKNLRPKGGRYVAAATSS